MTVIDIANMSYYDTFSDEQKKARHKRLNSNVKVLYHQTSKENAAQIRRDKYRMKRGSSGLAGGGIYFAVSKDQTDRKAEHRGVYITARVRLGNVKEIEMIADKDITFTSLLKEGYDSVKINRYGIADMAEYVVYNYDQVKVMNIEGD